MHPLTIWRGIREALGVYADIGGAVFTTSVLVGVAVVFRNTDVPGWLFVVALGVVAVIAGVLAFQAGASRSASAALEGELRQTGEDLHVASGYLFVVDDFLSGLRGVFGIGPEAALERLNDLRQVVLNAVVQGVSSERVERIRCTYLTPQEVDGETTLRIKYHQGHTAAGVEHLALAPDRRSIAGAAFQDKTSVYTPDAENDPRFEATEGGRPIGTLYCVPVFGLSQTGSTEPIGVVSVASNRTSAFNRLRQGVRVDLRERDLARRVLDHVLRGGTHDVWPISRKLV